MNDEKARKMALPSSAEAQQSGQEPPDSGWKMPEPKTGMRRQTKIGLLVVLVLMLAFGFVVFQRLQRRNAMLADAENHDSASHAGTADQQDSTAADSLSRAETGPPHKAGTSLNDAHNNARSAHASSSQQPFFAAQNEPRRIDEPASGGGISGSPFPADHSPAHPQGRAEPGHTDSHSPDGSGGRGETPAGGNPFATATAAPPGQHKDAAPHRPASADNHFPADDHHPAAQRGATPSAGNPFARSGSTKPVGTGSGGEAPTHSPPQTPPQTFARDDRPSSSPTWDLGEGSPQQGSNHRPGSHLHGSASRQDGNPFAAASPNNQHPRNEPPPGNQPHGDFHNGDLQSRDHQPGTHASGSSSRQPEPDGRVPRQNGPFFAGPAPRHDASGTNKASGTTGVQDEATGTARQSSPSAAQPGSAPRPLFGPSLSADSHTAAHTDAHQSSSPHPADNHSPRLGGFRVGTGGAAQARSTTTVQTGGTDDDLNYPFGRPKDPADNQLNVPGQMPAAGEAPHGSAGSSPLAPAGGHHFPGASQGGSPVSPDDHPKVYTVRNGDNYWTISRKAYGTARYFRALDAYNRHRISDPKKMRPGMKVLVPPLKVLQHRFPKLCGGGKRAGSADFVAHRPAGFFRTADGRPMYRVGKSDTLGQIARRHLGRASRWIQIYQMNRERITNPNRLKIGTELRLPADASRVQVVRGPRTVR